MPFSSHLCHFTLIMDTIWTLHSSLLSTYARRSQNCVPFKNFKSNVGTALSLHDGRVSRRRVVPR